MRKQESVKLLRIRCIRQAGHWTVIFLLVFSLMSGGCGRIAVHDELQDKEGEQTVIRIAWWGNEERHEITERVLDLYSQMHPGIVFETLPSTWDDYFEKLSLETAQGNMPDLIQMDYQYITTYSQNGSLADLAAFVEDGTIRTEDLDANMIGSGRIGGRLCGIVLGSSMLSMVYNPEVFDEAGLSYPETDWTWEDFSDLCMKITEKTGKYGVAMTPIMDLNLFQYWVRQHGETLFSSDQCTLGYEDDSVYEGYVTMFKVLMDAGAVPDSDSWAAINVQGPDKLPVVTGGGGMMQEWNNFVVKMSDTNENLKLVTPPLMPSLASSEAASMEKGNEELGLWLKPGMFFSVAETSDVKRECAQFIDWFINSREANEILKGERGVPVSSEIRNYLLSDADLPKSQKEMFDFANQAMKFCGDTPPPEPAGIEGINEAFSQTANMCFYGVATPGEAAAEFRRRVNEILLKNKER